MSSSTGMAGLAVTALVSALVAFGVAALVGTGPAAAPTAPGGASGRSTEEDLRLEVSGLRREVAELRRSRAPGALPPPPASGTTAPAGTAGPGTGTSTPGSSAEGPLPTTRADLVALIDQRIGEKAPGGIASATPGRKRVSIEEAGAELGLSSVDIDTTKRIWRESEGEAIGILMGTTDMDVVKQELREIRDDPDRKAAFINKAVGNAVGNFGRLMTIQDRRDRELRKYLPAETVKKLRTYDIKPGIDDSDLEGVLKEAFGGEGR